MPEGMLIQLNMDDLHFNPDLWGKHDPQKFVPERYSYLVHLFNLQNKAAKVSATCLLNGLDLST